MSESASASVIERLRELLDAFEESRKSNPDLWEQFETVRLSDAIRCAYGEEKDLPTPAREIDREKIARLIDEAAFGEFPRVYIGTRDKRDLALAKADSILSLLTNTTGGLDV